MRETEDSEFFARLISQYDRLIREKAAKCMKKAARYDAALSFDDLYQAGIGGLLEAHATFDEKYNVPYQAHLVLRIYYAIYNEYSRNSQLSKHASQKRRIFEEDVETLEQIYCRPVTLEEVAEFLSLPLEEMENDLVRARAAAPTLVSLTGSEEMVSESYLSSEAGDPVESAVHKKEVVSFASTALACLTERQRFVIVSLFFEGKSLQEVGNLLRPSVKKQRVAVIRDRALTAMRKVLPENFSLADALGGK